MKKEFQVPVVTGIRIDSSVITTSGNVSTGENVEGEGAPPSGGGNTNSD